MKLNFWFLRLSLFVFSSLLLSTTAQAAQLTIKVENIKVLQGKLHISIFSDRVSYEKDRDAVKIIEVVVVSSTHEVVIEDLADGEYAIQMIHDENDNGKLDTNFVGIPKEGYGFSNNGGRYGPPKFEKAMFLINDKSHISIRLH